MVLLIDGDGLVKESRVRKKIRALAKKTTNPSIPLNDLESDKDGIEKYLLFIINFR